MAEYLILKSRLAAEQVDADEAFRMMALAMNFQDHCAKVELPNFLSETVVILLVTSSRAVVMEHILPKLGKDEDLQRWRKLLSPPASPPARYAKLLVGEWHLCGKYLVAPVFVRSSKDAIPDPEAFLMEYGSCVAANAKVLPTYSVGDLLDKGLLPIKAFNTGLSTEAVGLLRTMNSNIWRKGFIFRVVYFAQFDAVMDLLMREKAGEDLSRLTITYVLNPVTGDPFGFDPAARTVLGSDSSMTRDIVLPW